MSTNKKIKFVGGDMYEYELYPLVDKFNSVLLTKCEPFYFEDTTEHQRTPVLARYLAVSLLETMKENYGVGLAANQVGIPLRVFVMGTEGVGFAFFNPEIIETTGMTEFKEGCLTYPGLFLSIKRPESVKIKYQDMNGVHQEKTFTGFSARIILHEYDHMEGIVFTSKISPILLDRAKTKVKKNLKLLERQRVQEQKITNIRKAMGNIVKESNKKLVANDILTVSD
jgi:peptide deformylase